MLGISDDSAHAKIMRVDGEFCELVERIQKSSKRKLTCEEITRIMAVLFKNIKLIENEGNGNGKKNEEREILDNYGFKW